MVIKNQAEKKLLLNIVIKTLFYYILIYSVSFLPKIKEKTHTDLGLCKFLAKNCEKLNICSKENEFVLIYFITKNILDKAHFYKDGDLLNRIKLLIKTLTLLIIKPKYQLKNVI